MNDRPEAAQISLPFEIGSIDFASIPGQSKLFLDHIKGSPSVFPFYPTLTEELHAHSETVLRHYETDRASLVGLLKDQNEAWGAGAKVRRNIDRLRSETSVAVMTGQQAGLFSGPAYTIYKAITAIRLAGHLTDAGLDAVPVFWIASEDHDIDEVSSVGVVGEEGDLVNISCGVEDSDRGKAVGLVPFGEGIPEAVELLERTLPGAPGKDSLIGMIKDYYRPGTTYSDAFARMLTRLFEAYGLVLVSPMDPGFRRAALPIVEKAVRNAGSIRDALIERDSRLESAGYHSQVRVTEDFFPFFLIEGDGTRKALRFGESDEEIVAADGGRRFTTESLVELLRSDPSVLSPSALMRPVVQDYVFPNVCYIGGAAEIAYFGQNSAVYDLLERPVTPVRHRAAFTIVEPRNRRTMEKYGLGLSDLFEGREAVNARVVERVLSPETSDLFNASETEISRILERLGEALGSSDPTLAESLEKRKAKVLWHIETLREKFRRSEILKDEIASRRLDYLFNSVLPDGGLQERSLSYIHFLNLYGAEAVEWLVRASSSDQRDHRIVNL